MATITSAQSGNWSNTATWVGGVVPTAADSVIINHTIAADVDITVLSINASVGRLNITTSRNLTCTGNGITYSGGHSTSIWISAAVGQVVNINSNIVITGFGIGSLGTIQNAINITSTGTVNITGNIVNNVTFGDTNTTAGYGVFVNSNNSVLNIVGNLTGSIVTFQSKSALRINNVSTTINIIGNLTANGGCAIDGSGSGSITTNGNTFASINNFAINTTGILIVAGGSVTNVSSRIAIYSPTIQISSNIPTQWLFQTNNALVTKTLYDVNTLPTIPVVGDVRNGVSYASGALTGTLVVPPANAVTAGVTYDNGTVGTAQNTAASFLTALGASSDPLAVRLQNVATVQTTGDQIAAAL